MIPELNLCGKSILVIGGAGGLGSAIVEAYVLSGAQVVVIDKEPSVSSEAHKEVDVQSTTPMVIANISNRDEIRQSFARAMEYFSGPLDVLVHAAGIQRREESESFPEEDWDQVIAVNLTSVFLYCQLAAREMIPRSAGKIINLASIQSYCGGIKVPAYVASKGGVGQLTKALANDWAPKGLNVNAIAPGYMDTPLAEAIKNDPMRNTEILSRVPQGRWGRPDDLKGLAILLASKAGDFINGAVIPVDGGYLAR